MATELSFRLLNFGWLTINKRLNIIVRSLYFFGCQPICTAIQINLNEMTEQNNWNSTYDIFSWMSMFSPVFNISGSKISVIHEPSDFFNSLKTKILSSSKRIILSSLYLGTGKLEKQLTDCLYTACQQNLHLQTQNPFRMKILLEYTRGSRGLQNSRTMLLPVLSDFNKYVNIALYHSPDLRGLIKWLLPEKWNEVIGLNHMKIYLFDDTLIMSGANLSDQYFVNRQDRYVVIEDCEPLADFFEHLVETVSSFSFQLQADNTLSLAEGWNLHPYKSNKAEFKAQVKQKMHSFYEAYRQQTVSELNKMKNDGKFIDTWIFPLIQMGPFQMYTDDRVTQKLMHQAVPETLIKLASGYFNLTNHYMDNIIHHSFAYYDILMASPKANGFFGTKGILGAIPNAYSHIAKLFFEQVRSSKQSERIKMSEYFRSNWTFHVKGLWYYLPQQCLPSLSFIGSPNFGYRSIHRDLEVQLAIVTDNLQLREQFHQEQQRLYSSTEELSEELFKHHDHQVPLWVKFIVPIIKNFF